MDLVVKGGDELYDLARRLRKAGEKELGKQLQKAIKDQVKPIVEEQRRRVRALPSTGPKHTRLRSRIAGKVRVSVKSTGANAGVRIQVAKSADLGNMPKHLNTGTWRHPVFGQKKVWVSQSVPPGWFDKPAQAAGPKVRKSVVGAMNDVADKIAHGGI